MMPGGVHAEDIAAQRLNQITRSPHNKAATTIAKASYSLASLKRNILRKHGIIAVSSKKLNSAFLWSLS